jgi:hypothetical protein
MVIPNEGPQAIESTVSRKILRFRMTRTNALWLSND